MQSLLQKYAMQKNAKKKKSKKSIVHATKRSKRGIEPAPLAIECTSVTSQTQRVIRWMDAQQSI